MPDGNMYMVLFKICKYNFHYDQAKTIIVCA